MDNFCVKKSYKDGHVCLRVSLKARSWSGDTLKIDGGSDITAERAREIAKLLIEEADKAEAKFAAKKAAEDRRRQWRDREIAAGRMKIISLRG